MTKPHDNSSSKNSSTTTRVLKGIGHGVVFTALSRSLYRDAIELSNEHASARVSGAVNTARQNVGKTMHSWLPLLSHLPSGMKRGTAAILSTVAVAMHASHLYLEHFDEVISPTAQHVYHRWAENAESTNAAGDISADEAANGTCPFSGDNPVFRRQ